MQTLSPVISGNVAERYAALVDLSRVLTGILRPADLYEAMAARLARALPLDVFLVSTVQTETDTATVVFRSDAARAVRGDARYPASKCLAIRDRRPVLHLPGDPAAACAALDIDVRGRPAISAPVIHQGHVTGVLTVQGPAGSLYDSADLEFLAAAADLVALATPANAASADAAHRELEALDPITRAVAVLSVDDALDRTTRAAHDLAGADGTALWLVRSSGEIEVAHACGPFAPRRGEKLALSHELFRELAGRTRPVAFDYRKEERGSDEVRRLTRGGTGVMLGLHAQDRVLGALVIAYRDARTVSNATLASLNRLASLAAIAAGYSRLSEQISALSLLDPLTGVPNKRQLAMYLEKEFAAARRGRKLTILLFDLDDFERYNKTHGRHAGDAVLRAFGEMLVGQTRAMNLAARYEDDTFIVALADADRRAGFIHASRIARAAESHPLIGPSGVHASVGIASYAPRMKTFEDLIRAAEKDLQARRTGGGRLTI